MIEFYSIILYDELDVVFMLTDNASYILCKSLGETTMNIQDMTHITEFWV